MWLLASCMHGRAWGTCTHDVRRPRTAGTRAATPPRPVPYTRTRTCRTSPTPTPMTSTTPVPCTARLRAAALPSCSACWTWAWRPRRARWRARRRCTLRRHHPTACRSVLLLAVAVVVGAGWLGCPRRRGRGKARQQGTLHWSACAAPVLAWMYALHHPTPLLPSPALHPSTRHPCTAPCRRALSCWDWAQTRWRRWAPLAGPPACMEHAPPCMHDLHGTRFHPCGGQTRHASPTARGTEHVQGSPSWTCAGASQPAANQLGAWILCRSPNCASYHSQPTFGRCPIHTFTRSRTGRRRQHPVACGCPGRQCRCAAHLHGPWRAC